MSFQIGWVVRSYGMDVFFLLQILQQKYSVFVDHVYASYCDSLYNMSTLWYNFSIPGTPSIPIQVQGLSVSKQILSDFAFAQVLGHQPHSSGVHLHCFKTCSAFFCNAQLCTRYSEPGTASMPYPCPRLVCQRLALANYSNAGTPTKSL